MGTSSNAEKDDFNDIDDYEDDNTRSNSLYNSGSRNPRDIRGGRAVDETPENDGPWNSRFRDGREHTRNRVAEPLGTDNAYTTTPAPSTTKHKKKRANTLSVDFRDINKGSSKRTRIEDYANDL